MYCLLSSKITYFRNNVVTDDKLIISSCSFRRMRAHSRNIYCLEYCIKTCSQHFFTTTFHFQNLTEWTVAMILSIFCNYLLQQEKKLVYSMIIISRIEYKFKCQNAIRVAHTHTQKKTGAHLQCICLHYGGCSMHWNCKKVQFSGKEQSSSKSTINELEQPRSSVGAKPKLGLMRSPGVPWKLFPLISCLMNVRHQAD